MEPTWTLTNTAVQYVEWWTITKVQATGWDKYILIYILFILFAIRLIGKAVNAFKKAIREPIQETDEQIAKRIHEANERSKKIREENEYITNSKKNAK